MATKLDNLVFVGLNSRVAALDNRNGRMAWMWRAPKPWRGYVSLLLVDKGRLIVSVNGYTHCLDPESGEELWSNSLPGFGMGVTALAALGKNSGQDVLRGAAADAAAAAAAGAAG